MAAPRAGAEDVEIEMPEQNHQHLPPHPSSFPPSVNPSLNVSRADSDMERGSARTEDMSDYGADRETIGMRYACPNINLGCGTPDKPVYSNPKYTSGAVPGKKRYPTLDRPPSRAASQSTVHETNQSTADLVGKKGEPAKPDSGVAGCCKSFWKDPRYDKLRIILLILLLVIILLLIIILPIVLRKPSEEAPEETPDEYEVVYAPLAVCGNLQLEGYKKDGVAEYRGVPYAVPPLNEKRWLAATPIDSQNCESLTYTKADHFGHQCVQSQNPVKELESEDCLYLNVWTPTNHTAATKLPVMVYFHDGDFKTGSGNAISRYPLRKTVRDGQYILVSMNFRLHAFGFMALEALPATNVGLTDMLAALKWVQENIAGFGGDKTKVTAFGLGSGATSILALLNSNELTGLVHRAWLMSPGVVQDQPMLGAKTGNVRFLTNIGCQLADIDSTKRCLYEKSAAQILAAVPWNNGPRWAQPLKFDVPDKDSSTGPYIVTDALVGGVGTFDALTAASLVNKQIPVIIGNADAEADIRPPSAYFGDGSSVKYLTAEQLDTVKTRLEAFDPDIMAKIQNGYSNLETELGFTRLVGDIRALCPSNHIADHLQKMSIEVYRYIYEFQPRMKVSAFNYDFWASYTFHGIDMLAFFGALDGDEFSPYFNDAQSFAASFRSEIHKFIRGEALTWQPMPRYMSLTASATVAQQADTLAYPRNCDYWSSANMIPAQTWSN